MSIVEAGHLLPNFSLEKGPVDVDLLKAKGYDGFGAVIVIINEHNEILMVREVKDKEGDKKKDQWGPVYETGNAHDDNPEITMIAGLASELGFGIINKLERSSIHTYGYDFRRRPDEAPSRSLITVCYLKSSDIPPLSEWGHEISEVKWLKLDDIYSLPEQNLRVNAKNILIELARAGALHYDTDHASKIELSEAITPDFLALRTPETDIHWTRDNK